VVGALLDAIVHVHVHVHVNVNLHVNAHRDIRIVIKPSGFLSISSRHSAE